MAQSRPVTSTPRPTTEDTIAVALRRGCGQRVGEPVGARAPGHGGHCRTSSSAALGAVQRGADPRVQEAVGEFGDRVALRQRRIGAEVHAGVAAGFRRQHGQVGRVHPDGVHAGGIHRRPKPG